MASVPLPVRKKNRLPQYDYASVGAYFVTICVAERQPILWENADCVVKTIDDIKLNHIGQTVLQGINQLHTHYPHIHIDKFCIMPDHIHLLMVFQADDNGRQIAAPTLSVVVGNLKRWVSMQLGFSIWQKSFYDRIVRNEASYHEIWQYIDNNPLKSTLREHYLQ